MKTKARLVAESVRLKQWSQQIRDCQNRPVGLTMDDWCRQQGITKANYYSRLRRVRQAILNYSSEENGDCNLIPDFVELPVPGRLFVYGNTKGTDNDRKISCIGCYPRETKGLRLMFSLKHHQSCYTLL